MKKQVTPVKARKRGRPRKDYSSERGVKYPSGITVLNVPTTRAIGSEGPMARARCKCGKTFTARLRDIKAGHTRSCECLKIEMFNERCDTAVNSMTPDMVAEIWELRRRSGRKAVAAQFEVPAEFIDFANRKYETQLDAIALDMAKKATTSGVISEPELARTSAENGLSDSAVRHVRKAAKRISDRHRDRLEDLVAMVVDAAARVNGREAVFGSGYRDGEFTFDELRRSRGQLKGEFDWLHRECLDALEYPLAVDQRAAIRGFLKIADKTLRSRRERQKAMGREMMRLRRESRPRRFELRHAGPSKAVDMTKPA